MAKEKQVEKEIMIKERLFKDVLTDQIDHICVGVEGASKKPFRIDNNITLEKTEKGIQVTMKVKAVLDPKTTKISRTFDVKQMSIGDTQ